MKYKLTQLVDQTSMYFLTISPFTVSLFKYREIMMWGKIGAMGVDRSKFPNLIAVAISWLHWKCREKPFCATSNALGFVVIILSIVLEHT